MHAEMCFCLLLFPWFKLLGFGYLNILCELRWRILWLHAWSSSSVYPLPLCRWKIGIALVLVILICISSSRQHRLLILDDTLIACINFYCWPFPLPPYCSINYLCFFTTLHEPSYDWILTFTTFYIYIYIICLWVCVHIYIYIYYVCICIYIQWMES